MATPTAKPALTATAATDTNSKVQKIINNSGVDISVCMPLTSAEKENGNALIAYNKDYVLLPASSGNIIKAGASATVTLDRSYMDPDTHKDTYSMGYDLIIGSAIWLSPIANIPVAQDYDLNNNYFFDDVTVTADTKTAMDQTAAFYQTIAAYPDSQLAKNYVAAMNNLSNVHTDSSSSSDDAASKALAAAEEGVTDFFKSTKSYQKVSLATIVALEGYYNRFSFAWSQFADTATYYLYSSDGTKTTFQGALSFSKSGIVDITKLNSGYKISFEPAVNGSDTTKVDVNTAGAKTLTYSDGLFVDDLDSDMPTIALKGSFQLKRTFTKDPNDTKIMVVISGTINGQVTVGFDQSQCTNGDNTTQDWLDSLFHPKTAAEIFNSVMQILGALMMLHFVATTLWGIGKWIRQKAAAKEPVPDEDLQAEKTRVQAEWKAKQADTLKKTSAGKESLPDTPEDGLTKAANSKSTLSDCVSSGQMQDGIFKIKDNLKAMEEYVIDDYTGTVQLGINESSNSLRKCYSDLTKADIADLKATLAELRPKLQELTVKVSELNTKLAEQVATEQKAAMDENVKAAQEVEENISDESKTSENESNDAEDADPPAEGIEFPVNL